VPQAASKINDQVLSVHFAVLRWKCIKSFRALRPFIQY